MKINDYPESNIREKILNKLDPALHKGRKHDKAYVYIDDTLVTKVKLPNAHDRVKKDKTYPQSHKVHEGQYFGTVGFTTAPKASRLAVNERS